MSEAPVFTTADVSRMQRALELARLGEGYVEPNPMVGCVIVRENEIVGEGYHRRFGAAHAEVEALEAAGEAARGATMYVTLEPCCHYGKTPPCTAAILAAGLRRIVVAQRDPFPQVAGGGLRALREAGLDVAVGLLEAEARDVNAPYCRLVETGCPWIIAKWAMSLDGKIASRTGDSRWISCEESRAVVHRLRGRVDAVVIGRGTVRADDPLLTARPPGPRTATRIVLDSYAWLPLDSQLVRTARDVPLLVAAASNAEGDRVKKLQEAGCEVLRLAGETHAARLAELLAELGRRRLTNVLVEGGAEVLGSLHDSGLIDELHLFLAPKLIGGAQAPGPVAGLGLSAVSGAMPWASLVCERIGSDIYLHGKRCAPRPDPGL